MPTTQPRIPAVFSEENFPESGTPADVLHFLLRFATLAPSGHNTQPWMFKIVLDTLELHADRSRALPSIDPGDRELVMSCGAALFHLRVATRRFGFEPLVKLLPDLDDPDLMAFLRLGPRLDVATAPNAEDYRLFEAIQLRHTHRLPFEDRPLTAADLSILQAAAEVEGARVHWFVEPGDKQRLTHLIAEADHIQGADPRFRRELAGWLRTNRTRAHDGLPGYVYGVGSLESLAFPFFVRSLDWGERQADLHRRLAEESPALLVLTTERDDMGAHLVAGQALDRVLLTAAAYGLSASFLNQPLQVLRLRPAVAALVEGEHPQVVLRVGYGKEAVSPPRRPAAEVLSHTPYR